MLLPLAIASCGGDNEPKDPNEATNETNQNEIVEHTFTFNGVDYWYKFDGIYVYARGGYLGEKRPVIEFKPDYAVTARFVDYGQVSSIYGINKLPTSGWGSILFDLKSKEGYVVENFSGGDFIYYRIFVSEFIYSASGDLVGIRMQIQQYKPSK